MVCIFCKLVEAYSLDVWIGRVGSKMNPADLPARVTLLPFKANRPAQFSNLYKLLLETLVFKS